jgi:hypothetical protein
MWILISMKKRPTGNNTSQCPSDQKNSTERHPEQARVDRMARDTIRTVGTKLVLDLDCGRGAPHGAQRDAGPQREGG